MSAGGTTKDRRQCAIEITIRQRIKRRRVVTMSQEMKRRIRMSEYKCAHCGKDASPANRLWMSECFYDDDTAQWVGHGEPLCVKCWEERMRLHAQLDKEFFKVTEDE